MDEGPWGRGAVGLWGRAAVGPWGRGAVGPWQIYFPCQTLKISKVSLVVMGSQDVIGVFLVTNAL
jgi:hypothetical protein